MTPTRPGVQPTTCGRCDGNGRGDCDENCDSCRGTGVRCCVECGEPGDSPLGLLSSQGVCEWCCSPDGVDEHSEHPALSGPPPSPVVAYEFVTLMRYLRAAHLEWLSYRAEQRRREAAAAKAKPPSLVGIPY